MMIAPVCTEVIQLISFLRGFVSGSPPFRFCCDEGYVFSADHPAALSEHHFVFSSIVVFGLRRTAAFSLT